MCFLPLGLSDLLHFSFTCYLAFSFVVRTTHGDSKLCHHKPLAWSIAPVRLPSSLQYSRAPPSKWPPLSTCLAPLLLCPRLQPELHELLIYHSHHLAQSHPSRCLQPTRYKSDEPEPPALPNKQATIITSVQLPTNHGTTEPHRSTSQKRWKNRETN